jgi:hypothetical protein
MFARANAPHAFGEVDAHGTPPDEKIFDKIDVDIPRKLRKRTYNRL